MNRRKKLISSPPPFIRLFGITITIREADPDIELGDDETAKCFPNAALIIYDPEGEDEELRDTILHEILHIIDFKMTGDYTVGEDVICRFSAGITHLLRDNAHFAEWMVDNE